MVNFDNLIAGTGYTPNTVTAVSDTGTLVGSACTDTSCVAPPPHAVAFTPVAVSTAAVTRAAPSAICSWVERIGQGQQIIFTGVVAASTTLTTPSNAPKWVKAAGTLAQSILVAGLVEFKVVCKKGDPFDPNFQTVFSPQFQVLPSVPSDPCFPPGLGDEINQGFNQAGQSVTYTDAMGVTLNREQSAFTFGDDASSALQDTSLTTYTSAAASQLAAAQSTLQDIAAKIAGTPCDFSITQANVTNFVNNLKTEGVAALPSEEVQVLKQFGISPGEAVSLILQTININQVPLSMSAAIQGAANIYGQFASSLSP